MEQNVVCRTCLRETIKYVSIFSAPEIWGKNIVIAQMIMACAPVVIQTDDGLPSNICDSCLQLLQMSFLFRLRVITANENYKEIIRAQISPQLQVVSDALNKTSSLNHIYSTDYIIESINNDALSSKKTDGTVKHEPLYITEEIKDGIRTEEIKDDISIEEIKDDISIEEIKDDISIGEIKDDISIGEIKDDISIGEIKDDISIEENFIDSSILNHKIDQEVFKNLYNIEPSQEENSTNNFNESNNLVSCIKEKLQKEEIEDCIIIEENSIDSSILNDKINKEVHKNLYNIEPSQEENATNHSNELNNLVSYIKEKLQNEEINDCIIIEENSIDSSIRNDKIDQKVLKNLYNIEPSQEENETNDSNELNNLVSCLKEKLQKKISDNMKKTDKKKRSNINNIVIDYEEQLNTRSNLKHSIKRTYSKLLNSQMNKKIIIYNKKSKLYQ